MSSWADRFRGGRQPESWLVRSSTSTRVSFACPIDLVMSRRAFCWMRHVGTYDPCTRLAPGARTWTQSSINIGVFRRW
jgi:hypothetical protein